MLEGAMLLHYKFSESYGDLFIHCVGFQTDLSY